MACAMLVGLRCAKKEWIKKLTMNALFVWIISHQPTVLLPQNKSAITSQQYFSLRTNQYQPSATSRTNRLEMLPSSVHC
jgi:hypothetical protein